jgi:hypothetical protein
VESQLINGQWLRNLATPLRNVLDSECYMDRAGDPEKSSEVVGLQVFQHLAAPREAIATLLSYEIRYVNSLRSMSLSLITFF